MRLIYFHGCGDNDEKGSGVYVVAGIAVRDADLYHVRRGMRNLINARISPWAENSRSGLHVPAETEGAVCSEWEGDGPYDFLGKEEKEAFEDGMLRVARASSLKALGVVVEKREYFKKYLLPRPPELFSMELFSERCEDYLGKINDTGMLICSGGAAGIERIARDFSGRLRGTGMPRLPHITENLLSIPAGLSDLLPLAAFFSRSLFLKHEHGRDSRFKELRNKFLKLKTFPD
ncbi:MAG: hypothetical protein ABIG11_09220 [bacterium]